MWKCNIVTIVHEKQSLRFRRHNILLIRKTRVVRSMKRWVKIINDRAFAREKQKNWCQYYDYVKLKIDFQTSKLTLKSNESNANDDASHCWMQKFYDKNNKYENNEKMLKKQNIFVRAKFLLFLYVIITN